MADSQFIIAVHLATVLANWHDREVKSCSMAGSVNTNPAIVRKVTSQLAKAGLVSSVSGPGGGSRLAKPADLITLLDLYDAVGPHDLFGKNPKGPNTECMIGAHICAALQPVLDEARDALMQRLSQTRLSDILQSVQAASAACPAPASG